MQPTSPVTLLLALRASSDSPGSAGAPPSATAQRVEERPVSALAQGSYAWPAWAVVAVALVSSVGALSWWLRLRRRATALRLAGTSAANAKGRRP